jgi:hypothetical protein
MGVCDVVFGYNCVWIYDCSERITPSIQYIPIVLVSSVFAIVVGRLRIRLPTTWGRANGCTMVEAGHNVSVGSEGQTLQNHRWQTIPAIGSSQEYGGLGIH